MSRSFADIAFTPNVRAVQSRMGSRSAYAQLGDAPVNRVQLGGQETAFIHARDSFYQATVSETGWPYVQFRGGPTGFLKVLDDKTLGYADFRGNVQYISVGNLEGNARVSLILMDYANQRRLKLLGRVRMVNERSDPEFVSYLARMALSNYHARVERVVIISVEAFDWNCPQHITPRFTETEIAQEVAPLRAELLRLRAEVAELKAR